MEFCNGSAENDTVDSESNLSPKIISALRRSGMNNLKSILLSSLNELAQATKLTRFECQQVLGAASKAALKSNFVTCSDLKNIHQYKLSTGCPILNKFLHGGLLLRGITEISGESASGKTQICLQLSLLAQLPLSEGGLNGSVAYICTEDAFPSKRLHQIIQEFQKENEALCKMKLTDNIFITQVGDVESLTVCIQKTLPQLLACRNVKLIIVDSIAAVFRSDFNLDQHVQRAKEIQILGYALHRLAAQYKLLVVCVNQVSDVVDKQMQSGIKKHLPSLGLTWSNLVTTRIMLSRTYRRTELYKRGDVTVKLAVPAVIFSMSIEYAPHLPSNTQAQFIVTPCGVFGLSLL